MNTAIEGIINLLRQVGSMDPMIFLTFGLLVFAGMQAMVLYRAEKLRKSEREVDEARRLDRAFQAAWAEHFRLQDLANRWEDRDLLQLSALRLLDPKAVLPPEGSDVLSSLYSLSVEAGILGGVALAQAQKVAEDIATLDSLVRSYQGPGNEDARLALENARAQAGAHLDQLQTSIRRDVKDLSSLYWDACRHTPRAEVDRTMKFQDELYSETAQNAIRALAERSSSEQGPTIAGLGQRSA